MGYEVYGFIAKCGTFDQFKSLDERISVTKLNEELDLMLNDEYLERGLGETGQSNVPEGYENWLLNEYLIQICRELSQKTPVAYFLSNYVGGVGEQLAVVWKDGEVIYKEQKPVLPNPGSFGPINGALKLLGVVAEEGKDEFRASGLLSHRNMEDWFEASTGIDSRHYYEEF